MWAYVQGKPALLNIVLVISESSMLWTHLWNSELWIILLSYEVIDETH